MATGDVTWFDEAMSLDYYAGWATTDDMKLAIMDNTLAPTTGLATPSFDDFTEVTAAGTYTAGGDSLGNWGTLCSQTSGAGLVDSGTNPSWAADGSNATDAYWGIIYNDTQAGNPAIAYVELGGPVDMQAATLTVTWNGSGIATITRT